MKHFLKRINISRATLGLLALCAILFAAMTANAGTYTDSAHGNKDSGVDRSTIDAKYTINPSGGGYSKGNCAHCHEQHMSLQGGEPLPSGSGPNGVLLFRPESQLCIECHDAGPAADNINVQITKTYRHPTTDVGYDGRHTTSKLEFALSAVNFRALGRHAECADCHNPHQAKNLVHVNFGNTPPDHPANVNGALNNTILAANPKSVLKGVWGVDISSNPVWGTDGDSNYTKVDPATKEYQICFKCHTYYGLAAASGISAINGPSHNTAPTTPHSIPSIITSQGMEFSGDAGTRAKHPVYTVSTLSITPSWMVSPWTQTSTQTMYCSDCHGADNEASAADGPHGSTSKFMLKGDKQYWPASSTGVLWSLNDVSNIDGTGGSGAPTINTKAQVATELFCLNCHLTFGNDAGNPIYYSTVLNWQNAVHKKLQHYSGGYIPTGDTKLNNIYCITCHSAVPHGTRRSRLIVYASTATTPDVAPHVYFSGANEYAAIKGFKYYVGAWANTDCYSAVSGCNGASAHLTNAGGYQ